MFLYGVQSKIGFVWIFILISFEKIIECYIGCGTSRDPKVYEGNFLVQMEG